MVAFLFRMPSGIPGAVNRNEMSTIEAQIVLSTNPPTAYGVVVVMDAATNKIRPFIGTDTAASVYGINVRPYPTQSSASQNEPLGTAVPPTSGITNILKRGYISVLLGGVTAAAKNGVVFVRIALPVAGKPLGGFEAVADGVNTIALSPGTYFMGPSDAQGNTEIAFNI